MGNEPVANSKQTVASSTTLNETEFLLEKIEMAHSRGESEECSTVGIESRSQGENYDDKSLMSDTADVVRCTSIALESFTIEAPKGKLGLLLENAGDESIPYVFSVKEESILKDKVLPGDYVTRVNGADVTAMSAADVSHFIGKAARSQGQRSLTFERRTYRSVYYI